MKCITPFLRVIPLILTIFISAQAQAATLTVSTTTDELDATGSSTGCSLREAIDNINDYTSGRSITYTECGSPDGSSDTIVLESGATYNITIADSAGEEDSNISGDLDIKGNVTIQTDSTDAATVSGMNQYRIFDIERNNPIVTLNNLTIESGNITSGSGACLAISNATVTIQNSTILSCFLGTTTAANGAGIFAYSATLVIQDSAFNMNSITNSSSSSYTSGGAAIATNDTDMTITGSQFTNNTTSSTSTSSIYGGALRLTRGTHSIEQSSFSSNDATSNTGSSLGGAIYVTNATLDINNSTFYQNTVDTSTTGGLGGRGGAIYNDQGTLKINHSTIASNETRASSTTAYGGGIFSASGSSLIIKNSILANNISGSTSDDIYSSWLSYGMNIVETHTSGTKLYATGVSATDDSSTDPNLGTAGTYGGSTTVVPISTGSSAEDAGSCTDIDGNTVNEDQLGSPRNDGDCDIGAFELITSESGALCEDGIDNDADGQSDCNDSDCDCSTWYVDSDGDSYGSSADTGTTAYSQPSGYVSNNTDCDDSDSSLNAFTTYYPDLDGDGAGDSSHSGTDFCGTPSGTGYSENNTDCNDSDASLILTTTYYTDGDLDGYGDSGTATEVCDPASAAAGLVTLIDDCDDSNSAINPSSSEADSCSDGLDNDCDGSIDSSDSDCTVVETTTEEETTTVDDPTITTGPTEETPESAQGESGAEAADDSTDESSSEAEATSNGGGSSSCQLNPNLTHQNQNALILTAFMILGLFVFRKSTKAHEIIQEKNHI